MIDLHHARVIDGLRKAAQEHGEVVVLLRVLSESFPYFSGGDDSFGGDEKQRAYLVAAMSAAAFAAIDRGADDEGEGK